MTVLYVCVGTAGHAAATPVRCERTSESTCLIPRMLKTCPHGMTCGAPSPSAAKGARVNSHSGTGMPPATAGALRSRRSTLQLSSRKFQRLGRQCQCGRGQVLKPSSRPQHCNQTRAARAATCHHPSHRAAFFGRSHSPILIKIKEVQSYALRTGGLEQRSEATRGHAVRSGNRLTAGWRGAARRGAVEPPASK
jgi:hypothetical protein